MWHTYQVTVKCNSTVLLSSFLHFVEFLYRSITNTFLIYMIFGCIRNVHLTFICTWGHFLFLKAPWILFCAENPLSKGTEVRGIVWKTCARVINEGVCHRKHLALHSSWRGLSLLLLRVLVTCNSTSSPHQKETFFGRNNENKTRTENIL